MSVWVWILIGVGGALAVSLLIGVAVAAILHSIGQEFSKLMEMEPWALSQLTRGKRSAADEMSQHHDRTRIRRL